MRNDTAWRDDGISIPPPPRKPSADLLAAVRDAAASPALHQLGRFWFFQVQSNG